MSWYTAKIVFRIGTSGTKKVQQFDEQIRLIEAGNETLAYEKACAIGRKEEDLFFDSALRPVFWTFINVSDIIPITEIEDGTELYRRTEESNCGEDYVYQLNQRAESMRSRMNVINVN